MAWQAERDPVNGWLVYNDQGGQVYPIRFGLQEQSARDTARVLNESKKTEGEEHD